MRWQYMRRDETHAPVLHSPIADLSQEPQDPKRMVQGRLPTTRFSPNPGPILNVEGCPNQGPYFSPWPMSFLPSPSSSYRMASTPV